MTPEELAMHWSMSLAEVNQISNIINYQYFVDIVSDCKDGVNGWQAVLYANDGKTDYILMENDRHFFNKNQAIIHGTKWAQNIKMSPGQAKLMGVPEDAYLALKPIIGYDCITKRRHYSAKKLIYSSCQRD